LTSNRSDAEREPGPSPYQAAIDRLGARLGPFATRVHWHSVIGSTNDVALSLASEGVVVVADEQTAGRGRRGHTWYSPPGAGLYVSVVLTPSRAGARATRATSLLTLAIGVAIADGIEAATGLRTDLKWPNDVYAGGRKLAGLLAEAAVVDNAPIVVAGYGINVGPMAYPPELRDRATAIEVELGRPVDRALIFAETLAAIASRYDDLLAGRFDAILDAWRRRAPGADGARVAWTTTAGPRSGVTVGIDDDGALLVRADERLERIVAGELTWL
jgi:BirA family biotin operon repressor/biotin-[acetyl-CoA-carboxylase] ligase